MTLTQKIIKEFEEKFNNVPALATSEEVECCNCGEDLALESYDWFSDGYKMAVGDCKSFLLSSLRQVATEAIEAVRLERQILSGDFDAGYNSAIEDMEEKAKKFLENNF